MAQACGVSKASVQRVWHANGLKPHLLKTLSSEVELANRAAARSTYAKPVLDHMSLIGPDCSRSEMDRG